MFWKDRFSRMTFAPDGGAGAGAGAAGAAGDAGAAGGAGAGAAGGAGAGAGPSGLDSLLSPELRQALAPKGYKSPDDLARAYLAAESKIGAKGVVVPGEKATPADWDAFYAALGRPEAADKYEIKPAADLKPDPEREKAFRERAHKAGLTPRQAAALYADEETARVAEARKAADATVAADAALKQEWGAQYDAQIDRAKAAVPLVFGDKFEEARHLKLADGSYALDNPLILRGLAKIGELTGEAGGDPREARLTGGATTPDAARAEIQKLTADKEFQGAFLNSRHPEHGQAIARMQRLQALAEQAPNQR